MTKPVADTPPDLAPSLSSSPLPTPPASLLAHTPGWVWIALAAGAVYALSSLGTILAPFFIALIGAYILDRPVRWLERFHVPRALGALLMVMLIMVILISLVLIALPYMQTQLILFAHNFPDHLARTMHWVDQIGDYADAKDIAALKEQISAQFGSLLSLLSRFIAQMFTTGMAIANILPLIILTPMLMFYLTKDWPILLERIDELIPPKRQALVRTEAKAIDNALSAYGRGQLCVCMALAVLYMGGLSLIHLHHSLGIGLLTGALSFIPYVGLLIGLLVSLSIAYTNGIALWMVFSVFFVIPLIDANFVTPRFIGQRLGLHPVWIIFVLMAGGSWFGVTGILLALPSAAIISVMTRLAKRWYLKRMKT